MSVTLTAKFLEMVAQHPHQVIMISVEGGRAHEITYGQLIQGVRKVAAWLHHLGLRKGDRVGLILENRPEWCQCYFGILLAGGIAVPLDVQSRSEFIDYCLKQTQAKVLFASTKIPWEKARQLKFLKQIVLVGALGTLPKKVTTLNDIMAGPTVDVPAPDTGPQDLASIIYTSGTTGPPKGVMLTHSNLYCNYRGVLEAVGEHNLTAADNIMSILPLHHAFPFTGTLIVPLFHGVKLTYIDTLKADAILKCIRDQKVTILVVTPQVLAHFYQGIDKKLAALPLGLGSLLKRGLVKSRRLESRYGFNPARPMIRKIRGALGSQFRFFITGGAKCPEDLAYNFLNLGFQVLEAYGLTETSPATTINPLDDIRIGSVGKAIPGVEVKILAPDEHGLGQILIKGHNVMAGYYKNDPATREVLQDGWLYSGDLGYLDQDGYLYIQGRLKDVIILSSGKNVSAEEISQHYQEAPAIKEVCIIPDLRGDKLVAVVYPDFEYFQKTGETDMAGRVKWFLELYSQKLEPYKRVRDFVLTNQELPKTRLGKIKRHEVLAIYQERSGQRQAEKGSALEEGLSPIGQNVVEILQTKTDIVPVGLYDHLEIDLGLDSLALVELIAALEENFQFKIKEEQFYSIFTVAELIDFVEAQKPGGEAALSPQARSWADILSIEPPPDRLRLVGMEQNLPQRLFTPVCSLLFGTLFKLLFELKVQGQEHLQAQNCIICPNHVSFLDGFLIFGAVPWALRSRLFFAGATDYFELPVLRDFAKVMRVIPINAARRLVDAMQAAAYILRQGKILCIFPEGSRSVTGDLLPLKNSTAILAKELGCTVVPAYIAGSYQAWPPGAPLPRPHPIKVIFGPARTFAELTEQGLHLNPHLREFDTASLGLRQQILKLKESAG